MSRPRISPRGFSHLFKPPVAVAQSKRLAHHLPFLRESFPSGLGTLLSKKAFDQSWTQYQRMIVDRLSQMTVGTPLEDKSTLEVLRTTARDPDQAATFNFASMAHNNHHFFRTLCAQPMPMPRSLEASLERSFGSIETLRREMVLTALAMFGPGFVWLVRLLRPTVQMSLASGETAALPMYGVLPTYLAGSPYSAAGWRRQATDMATADWPKHSKLALAAALASAGPRAVSDASRAVNAAVELRKSEEQAENEAQMVDPFGVSIERPQPLQASQAARRALEGQQDTDGGSILARGLVNISEADAAAAALKQGPKQLSKWSSHVGSQAFTSTIEQAGPLGGIRLRPLLCVNTWEHVWLTDYGIDGKRDYLECWWNHIDWDFVASEAPAS